MTEEGDLRDSSVLIVEDEILVAWLAEEVLQSYGCRVLGPVPSVEDALAAIRAEAPDVVLLDINLRGERSFPVADALREQGVPFVFATGYELDGRQHSYGVPILQKPYAQAALRDALLSVLRSKEERDKALGHRKGPDAPG